MHTTIPGLALASVTTILAVCAATIALSSPPAPGEGPVEADAGPGCVAAADGSEKCPNDEPVSVLGAPLAPCSTDPMTGFFLVDRTRLHVQVLRPQGFKILLEILARTDMRIAEVPMEFSERRSGTSKASLRQGATFIAHLTRLRFGKMSLFALIGLIGALANLGIMWVLTTIGMPYVWAAIIGAEATIVGNFLLQERFVFGDMRGDARGVWARFAASFTFNNVEAALRIPIMVLMVETWHISSVLATAISLVVAFFARFLFHSLFVYAPRRERARAEKAEPATDTAAQRILRAIDAEAMRPGEL